MNVNKLLVQILLFVAFVAVGIKGADYLIKSREKIVPAPPEPVVPVVEVLDVRRETVELWVDTHGTVVPRTESRIVAEVSGRVVQVSSALVNGGFFEADDLLVSIDPVDYELAVQEARREVARSEFVIAQENADAAIAREDWESLGRSDPSPLVLREPQLAEARAHHAAAKAMLEKAQRDVERCEIRAPYAGRVRSENIDRGQWVARGELLAMVYAIDWAEVRLPLPDRDLARLDLPLAYRGEEHLTEGPDVTLSARFAGGKHEWHGRIVRTEGELDPLNRMLIAIARVEDPYGRSDVLDRPPLTVGMFVEARIRGRSVDDLVRLPREALRDGRRVYLVEDDRLAMRQVEVIQSDRDQVFVSAGLRADDEIIVSPLETVVEGMPVNPSGNLVEQR